MEQPSSSRNSSEQKEEPLSRFRVPITTSVDIPLRNALSLSQERKVSGKKHHRIATVQLPALE